MIRFLRVLGLWCLFSFMGVVAVLLASWALAAIGANGLITPVLVLGLASVLPVSLAVADNVVPRADHWARPGVSCPHCGAALSSSPGLKPDPETWPFL